MALDVIVIGAGAAGEAAGSLGAQLGAKVAVVERDLVGGQCSFWACLPSKSLLDSAAKRSAGADYPWDRASRRRDWAISREEIRYPNDSYHVKALEDAGAEVIRGAARIVGRGRVEVRFNGQVPRTLEASNLIVCTGSSPVIPPIEGLDSVGYWTSPEATSTRELPSSIVILGGGPVGVEMAQVFARFGVRTTLVESSERILARDHPNSSRALAQRLAEEGVEIRTGVKAQRVANGGTGRRVGLSDGSSLEAAQILIAVGRRPSDIKALGVEEAGITVGEKGLSPDKRMSLGKGLFVAGDVAGGLQFTHVADYEGRIAVRAALGESVRADLSSVPRTTFTDPETAAVGITQQEAQEKGIDAFEVTQDFTATARGQTIEGSIGHVTAVVDRERRSLVGAFAACPGASELIHEAVLAIKQGIPVEVLADTIHAFPTGARIFGNLMAEAAKQLS